MLVVQGRSWEGHPGQGDHQSLPCPHRGASRAPAGVPSPVDHPPGFGSAKAFFWGARGRLGLR
eukprot:4772083-Alexandrium_andersonii.AAC.1